MSAPYVVFLPGMLCDERLFAAQTASLTTPHHVADVTQADSIATIAEQVLAGAPDRFAAVGLSMGGIVALELWRQAPERLSLLLLIDTTPEPGPADQRPNKLEAIAAAAANGQRTEAGAVMRPVYLANARQQDDALLETMLDMAEALGPEAFTRQAQALRTREDSRDTLPTISIPTAVICGAEDRICTPDVHQLMATQIPDATLHVLPDCGHMASIECPDEVTAIMHALLAR
ncbi:MAG: alpha/beta hydrolase [Pseudomonadota bacterium]